ncbi:hypothetical protein V6N12_012548 [Hibiscus sabdariffa]|uniref:Secreted protein n=1 Tax=Hibiscus sabdariffa TaxID=183260 RepID=A0ABR2B5G7_9ROSI
MCWLFWKRRCRLLLASEVGVLDDVLVHGNQLTMECSRVGDKAMEPRDGRCLELHWNRPSVGGILTKGAPVPAIESTGIG